MKENYRPLFEPIRIGNVLLRNRYVMAPMGPAGLADSNGAFNQRAIEFYTARARGGVGLIIAGMCYAENAVEWHAAGSMPCPTIAPVMFKRTGIELTERVHAYGTKIFLQLSAGFGRVSNRFRPGDKPIAPSEIPYRWNPEIICRAISTQEVEAIVKAIGEASLIAKNCGFDGIEIHAMHEGYLIDQFAMACCNHRTDKYGGSLENRIRFAVEIVQEIKRLCGAQYPVVMRYSSKSFMKSFGEGALPGEDFQEFGRDMDEGMQIAAMLQAAGYDALDADVGCYDAWYWSHPPMYMEDGMYLPFNKELKKHVTIPVLTAGRLDAPDLAADAVRDGATDMISMARPLLADESLVEKIRMDRLEEIRPCLSCQEGCIGRLKKYLHISCAVNPTACREKDFALTPAAAPQKIAVIGGGLAGCEAARVLKLRGHQPTVFEKTGRLGGKMLQAGLPDFKKDDRKLIQWYERQMETLGVSVRLNTEVRGAADLAGFDHVILASGSLPIRIPLGDKVPVVNIKDVMEEPGGYAEPIAIVGGGLVGCEAALMLAKMGRRVSIVEALPEVMYLNGPTCYANKQMLLDLLKFHQIPMHCGCKAARTEESGLVVTGPDGERLIPAGTVALSIGFRADRRLQEELTQAGVSLSVVGDALTGNGNVLHAIWDAYEVAAHI